MALGKGIPLINGFDLNSKLPLDSRAVADTMEEMNALVANESVGDGQLCYCKADKKMYVLKDNVWSEVGGGGGKSVSPMLNLIDFNAADLLRTTITEEEYNNLVNGLYNQVVYTTNGLFPIYSPSKLLSMDGSYVFTQFKISSNADGTISYSSMDINAIEIDEKNTSNEYPITVTTIGTINPPSASGGGGSGSSSSLPIIQATPSGTIGDAKTYTIPAKQTSPFILAINNNYVFINVSINGNDYYGEYYYEYKYYYISGGDTSILLRENTSMSLGSKSIPLFTNYNILVDKHNNKTEILPCTASDNGKVLSVVNGEAQWATPTGGSGSISVTFED